MLLFGFAHTRANYGHLVNYFKSLPLAAAARGERTCRRKEKKRSQRFLSFSLFGLSILLLLLSRRSNLLLGSHTRLTRYFLMMLSTTSNILRVMFPQGTVFLRQHVTF
jgi:hypothetical protein